MAEWLKIALPALIALLGTVTAACFGYSQWRRMQKSSEQNAFNSDRSRAYKGLCELLEEINKPARIELAPGAQTSS